MTKPKSNFIRSSALVLVCLGLFLGACFRYGLRDQYYVDKGNLYMREGKRADAVRVFQEAVELNPHNAIARNNLGVALSLGRHYEEAEVHLTRAVELKPDYKEAWNNLGGAYLALLRLSEAHRAVERALQVDPDYMKPIRLRAGILEAEGRPEQALEVYTDYLKKAGEDFKIRMAMGRLSLDLGFGEEAVAHFRRAVPLNPRSPEPHRALALIYWDQDRQAIARSETELALEEDPRDARLLYFKAFDEVRSKNDSAGIKTYRSILRLDMEYLKATGQEGILEVVHRDLAGLYERLEKFTLALYHWTELLKINPQDSEAASQIRALRLSLEDYETR